MQSKLATPLAQISPGQIPAVVAQLYVCDVASSAAAPLRASGELAELVAHATNSCLRLAPGAEAITELALAALLLALLTCEHELRPWVRRHAESHGLNHVYLLDCLELSSNALKPWAGGPALRSESLLTRPLRSAALVESLHLARRVASIGSVTEEPLVCVRHLAFGWASLPELHAEDYARLGLDRHDWLLSLVNELVERFPAEADAWVGAYQKQFPSRPRPSAPVASWSRSQSELTRVKDFEAIMRRYNRRLYRVARGITRDDALAEDVVQEAYLKAFRNLEQCRERDRFGPWLTRIAVNEALSCARQRKRPREAEGHEPASSEDPERSAMGRQVYRFLEHAIERLPEDFRVVLVLRAVEELSTHEVADCLGIPEQTVKTRLHRARRLLLAELSLKEVVLSEDALPGTFPFAGARCNAIVARVLAQLGQCDAAVARPKKSVHASRALKAHSWWPVLRTARSTRGSGGTYPRRLGVAARQPNPRGLR